MRGAHGGVDLGGTLAVREHRVKQRCLRAVCAARLVVNRGREDAGEALKRRAALCPDGGFARGVAAWRRGPRRRR